MNRALRYEWAAMVSLRTPRWVVLGTLVMGALGSLLYGWLALELPRADPREVLVLVGTKPSLAPLGAALLAVLVHGGERRYGTRTLTTLLFPRRAVAAAARVWMTLAAAAAFAVLALGVNVAVGRSVLADRVDLAVGIAPLSQWLVGHIVLTAGCALLGLAVAELVPGRAALALVLGVPLVLEPMLRGSLSVMAGQTNPWVNVLTPYTAGLAMSDITPADASTILSVTHQPHPLVAAAIFLSVVAVVAVPGYRHYLTSDHGAVAG